MLTAQKLALIMLRYFGVTKFAAQTAGNLVDSYESAPDGRDLAAIINASIQDIHRLAPARTFVQLKTVAYQDGVGTAVLSDVAQVLPPVLWGSNTLREVEVASMFETIYRGSAGTPGYYHVDTLLVTSGSTNTLNYRLRVAPVPASGASAVFYARIAPITVTESDFGSDGTDPGKTMGMPAGWDESVLLGFCLQRLTAHPLFANESAKAEIRENYNSALAVLGVQGNPPDRLVTNDTDE